MRAHDDFNQMNMADQPMTDRDVVLPGPPPLCVSLRPSARARRLSLRVSGIDGRVTLSIPRAVAKAEALAFLREKEGWLRGAMARVPQPQSVRAGSEILLRGQRVTILEDAAMRRVTESGRALLVPADAGGARTGPRLETWFKASARAALFGASETYAAALGRRFTAISLRDTRSRWGSCTAQGRLMYSWRLIMAPPEVLAYVAAHEVAHLAHMDHSRAFWACVAGLMPDYQQHRQWLRAHGAQLHGYCFSTRPAAEKG